MSGLELVRLMTAIIAVESSGNDNAVNQREQAYGSMQIRQMVLIDVNRNFGTTYKLGQMKSRTVSKAVFQKYITLYKASTPESAARLWNGGPGWKKKTGKAKQNLDNYWKKVKTQLERSQTCQISPKKETVTKPKKITASKKTAVVKPPSKISSMKGSPVMRPTTPALSQRVSSALTKQ